MLRPVPPETTGPWHRSVIGKNTRQKQTKTTARNTQHGQLEGSVFGVIHLRSLANLSGKNIFQKNDIEELAIEPYFIQEGTSLNTQLIEFQKRRQRFALVVDEYGDIQGLVTLADILEEIVGEFTTDPLDNDEEFIAETFILTKTKP